MLLVAILVWWNDNTLFGVQPETVLAATFLGALSAVPLLWQSAAGASEPGDGSGSADLVATGR